MRSGASRLAHLVGIIGKTRHGQKRNAMVCVIICCPGGCFISKLHLRSDDKCVPFDHFIKTAGLHRHVMERRPEFVLCGHVGPLFPMEWAPSGSAIGSRLNRHNQFAFISTLMPWIVFPEALKTRPSGWGALHDIPVRRQFSAVRSTIVHRPLHLVEHENRRPSMMMDRLFVVRLQSYLEDAKTLVLENDFVVLRSRNHGIECRIPSRWIQVRAFIRHVVPPMLAGLKLPAQPKVIDPGRTRWWMPFVAQP